MGRDSPAPRTSESSIGTTRSVLERTQAHVGARGGSICLSIQRLRDQPSTLEDLAGARIGTLKASFMFEDLVAAGIAPARIDDTIRTGGIPAALRAGTILAGVDGIEAALVAQTKDPSLRIDMFLGRPASLAWGVRKQDVKLHEALDQYIGNVRRTATWNRLVVRHFGSAALEILKRARGES